jgi:hypothetical protein
VSRGKVQNDWAEVTITGWIIRSSVSPTTREGFDLSVTPSDGENVRAEPNGSVVARLNRGTLLHKIGSRGGWFHVKRTGWVPRRSLEAPIETGALGQRQNPTAPRSSPRSQSPTQRKSTPPAPAPANPAPAAGPQLATARGAQSSVAGSSGYGDRFEVARSAPISAAPGGNQLGTIEQGADARVLGKAGDWVRVQIEGWMHEADLKPSGGGALTGVSAAEVRADPQRFVGQTVEWRVQFIAIQQADELRAELPIGQPFLLTRGPLPEPGFVYVILPRDQATQFQSLPPLQELVLRVTIKAPRTKYLATPVVELVGVVSGMADASR